MWKWFCIQFIVRPLITRVFISLAISIVIYLTLGASLGTYLLTIAIVVTSFICLAKLVLETLIAEIQKEHKLSREEVLEMISKEVKKGK